LQLRLLDGAPLVQNGNWQRSIVGNTWFGWKAAKLTPQDAGKAWKVANFCPGEAAEAWPSSGFTLDELKEAWKVAEFSPAIATVRWLEEGFTENDITAAWASVGYSFEAVAGEPRAPSATDLESLDG
jgi:hypothetical protein